MKTCPEASSRSVELGYRVFDIKNKKLTDSSTNHTENFSFGYNGAGRLETMSYPNGKLGGACFPNAKGIRFYSAWLTSNDGAARSMNRVPSRVDQ